VLAKFLPQARNELEETWGQAAREQEAIAGEHGSILVAAANADRTMPKGRVEEETDPQEAEQVLTDLARDVAGQDKQKQEEYRKKIKDLHAPSFLSRDVGADQVDIGARPRYGVWHRSGPHSPTDNRGVDAAPHNVRESGVYASNAGRAVRRTWSVLGPLLRLNDETGQRRALKG
jgi:hypothetical protein